MKLNLEQLKSITAGAVKITEQKDGFHFYRFTDKQMELYKITNKAFYDKCFCSAGIRMMFKTNSTKLAFDLTAEYGTARTYFSFDVFVNGKYIDSLDNYSDKTLAVPYTVSELPLGEFSKEFSLGCGDKGVCVYFPWSVVSVIKEISIDDGAYIEPVKRAKKLLAFGDSITQGYDALRPSNRYASRLADKLLAEETNKGIGGEMFFPELAKLKENFIPDYITVAYGTNDWSKTTKEVFEKNCREFYVALSNNYPDSKIFAITPIWRKDHVEYREFGLIEDVEKFIVKAVADLENVTVISGNDFVPKDEKYYADFRLHPNDEGFEHYADNLYKKISENIF